MSSQDEDQTGVCFKDSRWLEEKPLNRDTVLEYFSLSGFYDRTCNNEQIKMQRLSLDKLKQMVGIEYVLEHAQEDYLFVILKQKREIGSIVPMAYYYVIHGTIYQSPNIFSVLSSRLLKISNYLQKSLKQSSDYYKYDVTSGYSWNFGQKKEEGETVAPMKIAAKQTQLREREDEKFVSFMINNLSRQFPPKGREIEKPSAQETTPPMQENNEGAQNGSIATPAPTPRTTPPVLLSVDTPVANVDPKTKRKMENTPTSSADSKKQKRR